MQYINVGGEGIGQNINILTHQIPHFLDRFHFLSLTLVKHNLLLLRMHLPHALVLFKSTVLICLRLLITMKFHAKICLRDFFFQSMKNRCAKSLSSLFYSSLDLHSFTALSIFILSPIILSIYEMNNEEIIQFSNHQMLFHAFYSKLIGLSNKI